MKRPLFMTVAGLLALSATPVLAQSQSMSAEELTRMLNGPPAGRTALPAPASAPVPAPAAAPIAAPVAAPARAPVSVRAAPQAAPAAPAAPRANGPRALNAAAIAALPFIISLEGTRLVERPAGPSAKIYAVQKGDTPLLMIYTGPQSQYPVYAGEQAVTGGRSTMVVTQDGRRIAAEHRFDRPIGEPAQVHVWLMTLDGPDAALAERIGQSIDIK